MAKVEDVSPTAVRQPQYVFRALSHRIPRGKKRHGIEVSLYGVLVPDSLPSLVKRHPPIQPDDLRASLRHGRQQRGAVGAEVDDRNAGLFLQSIHQSRSGLQRISTIVLNAQAPHPTVEDLDYVSSVAHLLGRVLRQ